jgi:hypothetical protein
MLLGNIAYVIMIFFPKVQSFHKSIESDKRFPIWHLVELFFYEVVSFFMVWSHLATMCVEPGFIPKDYRYKDD